MDPKLTGKLSFRSNVCRVLMFFTGLVLAGCEGQQGREAPGDETSDHANLAAEPWSARDLMDPAELASILGDPEREKPLILDIGGVGRFMGGRIQGSQVIGPTRDAEYLEKLRDVVSDHPREAEVIIYCGCCPFEDCPNIRPAFRLLKELKLENARLLDLPTNLRIDWVNRGYPTEQ